jgi:hypothetical protein
MNTTRSYMNPKRLNVAMWSLAAATLAAAVSVWVQLRLTDGKLTGYELFPLLGLAAFSLMWTHYIGGSLRRLLGYEKKVLATYFRITAMAVFALILLHPTIFLVQLWLDGFGLPPDSYLAVYSEPMSRGALTLGSLSLVAFLAFELHRKFRAASWWRYVEYATSLAMFLIFYHALTLGGEVSHGWYAILWWFYGASLAAAIFYNYMHDYRSRG